MEAQLEALGTGELFGLWFQSLFVGLTMNALSICIMLVIYGRMIEVYLTTSVGPIPLATMTNRDWSHTGQNYLKSLFALAFQAFLIMVCVGIYSVLVQSIATDGNISGAIWACIQNANDSIVISHSADVSSYKKRNYYMVDHAEYIIGVFDNQKKLRSGTAQTVNYALHQGKVITLIHPDTMEITAPAP